MISPIYLITAVGGLVAAGFVRRRRLRPRRATTESWSGAPAAGTTPADLERHRLAVRARFRAVTGPACEARPERVADIPPTASGKCLYTVSKVAPRPP